MILRGMRLADDGDLGQLCDEDAMTFQHVLAENLEENQYEIEQLLQEWIPMATAFMSIVTEVCRRVTSSHDTDAPTTEDPDTDVRPVATLGRDIGDIHAIDAGSRMDIDKVEKVETEGQASG
jgi:hypothetical protein